MQGDDDPNVLSSSKLPETNRHLKRKRDLCEDPTGLPPAKRSPIVVGDIILVNFPGIPSYYWSS